MRLPSSESEMIEFVKDRLPECQVGTLRTRLRICWHKDVYLLPTDSFFCVHSRLTMHGPFEYTNPAQVKEGLRIFFRAIQDYELANDVRRKITGPGTNAHMYMYLMVAAFVLMGFIAGIEHILPYDVPATAAPVVVPAPRKPPADCLPSTSGAPCIPFNQLIQQMQNTPEVAPADPAAANQDTI